MARRKSRERERSRRYCSGCWGRSRRSGDLEKVLNPLLDGNTASILTVEAHANQGIAGMQPAYAAPAAHLGHAGQIEGDLQIAAERQFFRGLQGHSSRADLLAGAGEAASLHFNADVDRNRDTDVAPEFVD